MWNAPHCSAASPSRASAPAVDEHRVLGAVEPRLVRDRGDVGLVVLAEVGGEGVRDRAVLAHPRERAARVEAAGEGDPDALADRQRAEDDAELRRADAHVFPSRSMPELRRRARRRSCRRARRRRRCCRRRSCPRPRAAPPRRSRRRARREAARRLDDEQRARRRQLARPAAQRRRELVEPAQVGGAREARRRAGPRRCAP